MVGHLPRQHGVDSGHGRPLVSARALDTALRRMATRDCRIVGWGTGSVFDYFSQRHPVRLEYLVDNDSRRWGQRRGGVEIVPPSRLLTEDESTVVIVYSAAWMDIQRDVQRYGRFPALPASALFAEASVRERLADAEALARHARPRAPRDGHAVVMQGPIIAGMTAPALRMTLAAHPDDTVIVSTWADTDPVLLDEVTRLADDVVLSPQPANVGIQNRNCQIVSTRAGVERAIARGAHTILKTRTDLTVLTPSVFTQARWWLDCVGSRPAQRAGLRQRLIVPASFTRKYLLYHPSDLVMLGAAEDMQRYWSAAEDPRSGHLLSPEWLDQPLAAVNMSGNPAESYLGLAFCRALGRPATGTLADSWDFYRDLFAVVDNEWFGLLWLKNLAPPDAALRSGPRQLVTQSFWQRLVADDPTLSAERVAVDPHALSLGALAGAA